MLAGQRRWIARYGRPLKFSLTLRLMKLKCPKCRSEIPLEDVNVAKDIALCRNCQTTSSFSELSQEEETDAVDLSHPPRGMWFRSQANEFEVGASVRSPVAFFLVPFTCVWAGFSLTGIYGTQIIHHKFELAQSLFGIPFLVGSVVLISITLMTVFGKVTVSGSGEQGRVFVGVGPLGWNRRFNRSEVQGVRISQTKWQQNNRNLPLLEIYGSQPIRFGSGLSEPKRAFMLAALRRYLRG